MATKAADAKKPTTLNGWKKGVYHVSHEKGAFWDEGLREYFAYRDLGMVETSGGKVRAHVIRPNGRARGRATCTTTCSISRWSTSSRAGRASGSRAIGEVRFEEGSCMYQEPEHPPPRAGIFRRLHGHRDHHARRISRPCRSSHSKANDSNKPAQAKRSREAQP